ncbi:MAG: anti-sigma factor antagonist [Caldithrix sp.]|nr:anti-sigma factor antagonist [Caldithrix sp.]
MDKMSIDSKFTDQSGEIMVVELGGHIDQSNTYELQKMFDDIIDSGCYKVIVDFGELYYMSSAGWGIFVGEIKRFRDREGDIKLANMNPEIYDVYQMLEFFHILEDYTSVSQAAASFSKDNKELDLVTGLQSEETREGEQESIKEIGTDEFYISEGEEQTDKVVNNSADNELIDFNKTEQKQRSVRRETNIDFISGVMHKDVKLSELPLKEKVKKVVAQNPLIGPFGIKKVLRHEHFGYTKVSVFKLIKLLRELDLNSKQKRYRYYRSC